MHIAYLTTLLLILAHYEEWDKRPHDVSINNVTAITLHVLYFLVSIVSKY
jgi:hypothetical protein